MKTLHRVSLVLIALPLVAILWSSPRMMLFVQPERKEIAAGRLGGMFSYENFVHEVGFARLVLAVIGLLILFIPYRKGERWAFAALAVLIVCYELPVFFFFSIPNLGTWPIFRNLPEERVSSLASLNFQRYFFTILAFAGLAIAVPQFITGRRNAQLKDVRTI